MRAAAAGIFAPPKSRWNACPGEVGNTGMELFRNFCFREPVLTVTFSFIVGDTHFSYTVSPWCGSLPPSWKASAHRNLRVMLGSSGLRTPWQQQSSVLLSEAKMLPRTRCSVHWAIQGRSAGPGAEMLR